MLLHAALCVLLGLQWADQQVSAAALPGPNIDPDTLCCTPKAGMTIRPLENIKTLEACKKICGTERRPVEFKGNKFGCLSGSPKYACAKIGNGAQCAECYQKGTCYLMPSVSGIKASKKTELTKKLTREEERKENVFREAGSGTRNTGLGGMGSVTSETSGRSDLNLKTADKLLTKKVSKSLQTKNHAGEIPGGLGISSDQFFGGGSQIGGGFTGRIGPNGQILAEEETQVGDKKSLLTTNKQQVNRQKENFVQDLSLTSPGSTGSFTSQATTSTAGTERGRRAETQKALSKTNRLQLSGTAAAGFGGGGGPVELLQQQTSLAGTENELRDTSQIQGTQFLASSSSRGPGGTQEVNSLVGRKTNRENVRQAIRGKSVGAATIKQVATDQGLNRNEKNRLQQQREILTGTRQQGSIDTLQRKGTRCVGGCTSTMEKRTKGTSSGRSQEKRQELSDEQLERSIRGRAGEGATVVTKGRKRQRAKSLKAAQSKANLQESYKGANSALGITGIVKGTVEGSAATRSSKRSIASEETISDEEQASLNINGFPTQVNG